MCMHNDFPTGGSEQMIVISFHDVTRISCAVEGGNYKRRAPPNLRLLSGYSGTKHSGLLMSHRPTTLAVLVPLVEKSISRMECVTCLSICMYPDLSGKPSVSVTLVFDGSQVGHYLLPLEPGIEQSMDHNPLGADYKDRINHKSGVRTYQYI